MAEVAVGAALAAEQVVSTGAQAGAAGYMVAKSTMPLKATYAMIANAKDDSTRRSLARSNHTLTVIANKAYIFGGETAHNEIATNDIHAVTLAASEKSESDYHLIPALPKVEGNEVPAPRTKHAACAFNGSVAVYGGRNDRDELIEEGSCIWLFDPAEAVWSMLATIESGPRPEARCNAKLFSYGDAIILFGGSCNSGESSEVWKFNTNTKAWTQLAAAPAITTNAALANGTLYLISGSDLISGEFHRLNIASAQHTTWDTLAFPANPMAPGPRARHSGGLLPVTTGYGRNYLVYFLGVREVPLHSAQSSDDESNVTQWSDMWTLQLPSSDLEAKPKFSIGEAIKPAKIKDGIRSAAGAETGTHTWAEVEVKLPFDLQIPEGKLHPGPRASFGYDVMGDGDTFVLWGGEDAKGERVGDGWTVKLE